MGIGFLEIVVIGVAALVLLGPQRLPEIMRQIAKFYVQMRRTSNDFKSAFDHVVREAEIDLRKEEIFRLENLMKNETKNPEITTTRGAPETAAPDASAQPPLSLRPEKPFGWDDGAPKSPSDSGKE